MLVLLLLACNGTAIEARGDEYALEFNDKGCAAAPLDGRAQTTALTIEATVRGNENPDFGSYPVLHWTDRLLLAELDDGRTWFGSTDTSTGGVIDVNGFMDGQTHHLAGTWDEGGRIELWVDGTRIGFADLESSGAGETLEIGCWNTDWSFQGLIDEVRISSVVRYTESFEADLGPFRVDDDTIALWHFDEGEGTLFRDAATGYDGTLEDVDWVPFDTTGD